MTSLRQSIFSLYLDHSKRVTLTQCLLNVGPISATPCQHHTSIGPRWCDRWDGSACCSTSNGIFPDYYRLNPRHRIALRKLCHHFYDKLCVDVLCYDLQKNITSWLKTLRRLSDVRWRSNQRKITISIFPTARLTAAEVADRYIGLRPREQRALRGKMTFSNHYEYHTTYLPLFFINRRYIN